MKTEIIVKKQNEELKLQLTTGNYNEFIGKVKIISKFLTYPDTTVEEFISTK